MRLPHLPRPTRPAVSASTRPAAGGTPRAEHPPGTAATDWLRLASGIVGAVVLAAGAVAVFRNQDGSGTAVLLAIGGVFLMLALLWDRVESLEFGSGKLRLAGRLLGLAEQSERQGDPETAARLRERSRELVAAATPVAAGYRAVRQSMPHSWERTAALERIVEEARELARSQRFEPALVAGWLREGSDELRITALGMMQADPALRDFGGMLAAIADPRSAFEQYHALRLAQQMTAGLAPAQREELAALLRDGGRLGLPADGDRGRLSQQILATLAQLDRESRNGG
jgi:hypothetical protein